VAEPPRRLTLDVARTIIDAMIAYAVDNKMLPGSYAVADAGGHVVAFERRDEAPIATADIAIDKAWTAATMKASGRILEVITRGQGWRLNVKYGGRLTIIPGTVPIIAHGRIIGGIGHSGESAENDLKIAQAGLAALYREDPPKPRSLDEGLATARRLAEEAMKVAAAKEGGPIAVAVTDEWGGLMLLYRQDGAPFGLLELARAKAWTAAAFKAASEDALKLCGESPAELCRLGWNERFLPLPGGFYVEGDGFRGALGVASLKPEGDAVIAREAASKLGFKVVEKL
jgi:uncharacterized protein GlcG (DUF336 family)